MWGHTHSNCQGSAISPVDCVQCQKHDDERNHPGKVRQRTVWSEQLIRSTRDKIKRNPNGSERALAWEVRISWCTMSRLLKEDLGMKSYKRQKRQSLKPQQRKKHLDQSKQLLNQMKSKPKGHIILFSDKTPFNLREYICNASSHYIASKSGDAKDNVKFIQTERRVAVLQVLAVVSSTGKKAPLIFLKPGQRLTAESYMSLLHTKIFPWAHRNFGNK